MEEKRQGGAEGIGECLELVELVDVVAGDDDRDLELAESGVAQVLHRADRRVVGAGAAGMAITDELLTHTDASVAIVERRSAPGGHWRVAYPFVRLHQPSNYYGVSSLPLGNDTIDEQGLNAGFYERAGAEEICAYYLRLLETRFLPSGRRGHRTLGECHRRRRRRPRRGVGPAS